MSQLRFAPIIRVSTESQEKKGESLNTQNTQIRKYVNDLDGIIPDHCWQYQGQEHATPDFERQMLDQLLEDSFSTTYKHYHLTEENDTTLWDYL